MDRELMENGLKMRRQVLGDEYVDRATKNVDSFNARFQEIVSEYCWGLAWTDTAIPPRERSILNLGMIAALGRMQEFETHVRGALRNGITSDELRSLLVQITVYCGVPAGVDCFRVARKVVDEMKSAG